MLSYCPKPGPDDTETSPTDHELHRRAHLAFKCSAADLQTSGSAGRACVHFLTQVLGAEIFTRRAVEDELIGGSLF